MKPFALLLLAVVLGSCEKTSQSPIKSDVRPPAIKFVLLDKEGAELITGPSTPLRVSSTTPSGRYFELGSECAGGGCRMIDAFPPSLQLPYHFVYSSGDLVEASVSGSAYWYLTLNGKTDTLYFDLRGVDPQHLIPAHPTFNGTPIILAQPMTFPFYVLRRKH